MQNKYDRLPVRRPSLKKVCLWVLGLICVLLVLLAMDLSTITGDGTTKETALRAEYLICEGRLSQYYVNGQASLNIASTNADALDKIIRDAAEGRYGTQSDLRNPINPVYQAIYQAYPETSSIPAAYKNAQSVLVGSFDNYVEENNKLFGMLSDYDDWRTGNLLQSGLITLAGFPSNRLVVHDSVYGKTYHGITAEDQMWIIVADPQTSQAYHTKILSPLQFPTPAK